jgi:putative phosphoesterase
MKACSSYGLGYFPLFEYKIIAFQSMPTLWLVYFFPPCYTSTQHEAQKGAAVSGIMRIGVLSDTHLQRIGREFKLIYDHYLRDVDVILHAGDFTASDVIAFLSKKPFHGVQGNMDSLEVKVSLPEKKVIEICGYRIGLVHGWGPSEGLDDRIRGEFHDVDAIVFGHSHKPANYRREGILFFNPGTTTGFSSKGIHTLGIVECGGELHGEIIAID